ncbi:MAG TPA: AsmA-like C-terminal region-containing protein [Candidatus Krumholzibacteria bacterium]|nr:AsmA-like C-terminal region-containing protein [Candidatus Krumholzibacteria bacterium]
MAKEERSGKGRRRWIVPAVVAVVILAAVVAGRLLVPAGAVRTFVAERLTASLGRPVTIADARGGVWPGPWVELRGLDVAEGPDGVAIKADALRLGLAWGPLLQRRIEVGRAELAAPQVTVRLAAPGTSATKAGAGAAPAAAPPTHLPVALAFERVTITDGRITVLGPDAQPVALLGGLHEELALNATTGGDVSVVGTTRVDTLRLVLPAGTFGQGLTATWRKDLRWDAAAGRLRILTSELALGELPVAVTGAVDGLASGAPVADLRLQGGPVNLTSLQGLVPAGLVPGLEDVASRGIAELSASVQGPLGGDPAALKWALHAALKQGALAHPALPTPIQDITVVLDAEPGRLVVTEAAAATKSSRISARGTVDQLLTAPVYAFDATADVDLAEAAALAPPDPAAPKVAGRAAATLHITGAAADPASLRLAGPLKLAGVSIAGPAMGLPVTDLAGEGRIDGTVLSLDRLSLRQGRSDYAVRGTVRDPLALMPTPLPGAPAAAAVDLELTSALIDVDEIQAAGREAETQARAAAKAAGDAGGAAAGTPAVKAPSAAITTLAKLDGPVKAAIGTLVVRQNRLTSIAGTAHLARGLITFDDATARVYGGAGKLGGRIDLSDPAKGTFALDLAVTGARAEEYFATTTVAGRFTQLASALHGGLDLTATLAGSLDDTLGLDLASLTAGGEARLSDGSMTGLPLQNQLAGLLEAPQLEAITFASMRQPFRIDNGRLTVEGVNLKAGPVTVAGSGWQALDGRMAAHLDLTLPPDYAQGLRRQLPAQMADLLLDAEGKALVLPVSVGGRADAPDVRLDTDALAAAAADRAQAKLARETDRLKQQAITEANRQLQSLLGAQADSAAAKPDSAAAAPTLQDLGKSLLDRLKKGGGGKTGGGG